MEEQEKMEVVEATAPEQTGALDIVDDASLFAMAETAEKRVAAINTIINASLKVTTKYDWCLIGGVPYLQESGVTKVARLFGISWDICPGYPTTEVDEKGHKTFTYRMKFTMGGSSVVVEGSRSSKDSFFSKSKSIDEIDFRDVKISAQTNCLNNGIKKLVPGLRNIDTGVLEEAGIDVSKIQGYTFKTGSKGGADKEDATKSGLFCKHCGAAITQQVASFSKSKYNVHLCVDCQDLVKQGKLKITSKPKPEEQPKETAGDLPL